MDTSTGSGFVVRCIASILSELGLEPVSEVQDSPSHDYLVSIKNVGAP
jgi:hypothetical protein